ncbi:hypothetical protein E2C01_029630 [Portunus trituberculatus]|uniref:Uncharacterized protein n=1 Tax=Portunus trituberculatus TaxID=210409 RepID=A0A5B7EPV4_PORTR|nr:hypothetical protein [Portunus trituberculatus]
MSTSACDALAPPAHPTPPTVVIHASIPDIPHSCPTHLASDSRRRLLDHSTPATDPSVQSSPGSDHRALYLAPQAFPAHDATLLHHSPHRDITRK